VFLLRCSAELLFREKTISETFFSAGLDAVLLEGFLLVILGYFHIQYDAFPWQQESCLHVGAAVLTFQSPSNYWNKTPVPDELKRRCLGCRAWTKMEKKEEEV